MESQKRGSIAFFTTYRPLVPLDIFSLPLAIESPEKKDELRMTDGSSYNYNGHDIPPSALKLIINRPKLVSEGFKAADVDSGRTQGMVFVSERANLETLHISIIVGGEKAKVFSFSDVYGTFGGVRMEDVGCFAGDNIIYVTTKDPAPQRRQPWTAVYKTNLKTGLTERLTPKAQADLSPAASPSGTKIAVASFQINGGWNGEIEDLQTAIYLMNVEKPPMRKKLITNGGWPTWASEDVIFFHRKVDKRWAVFRYQISTNTEKRVTPDTLDAITPAAIDVDRVAVATMVMKPDFSDKPRPESQYRHIEIYDTAGSVTEVTKLLRKKADHYNPFVIKGANRIGYHRCNSDFLQSGGDIERQFQKLDAPHADLGLFRVSGVFPTFSTDGTKLAFVDNEFKAVWVADSKGLRVVYEMKGADSVFSTVWNSNPAMDVLYVCMGPSFHADQTVDIFSIPNASRARQQRTQLTDGFNNAFPSTNPDGTKLVFRSTRGGNPKFKNLYIMQNAQEGEFGEGEITQLTTGDHVDSHCQWSPSGDWIVFSSTRDKPKDAPETDNGLDPGCYAVFLVKWNDPTVLVRVLTSGSDVSGHVNHPFFSPDGKSIVITSDLAGVSVDPISMPLFVHSVRPYGDIFTVDIDPDDINKNKNVKKFTRITHSRYENSTAVWTKFSTDDPNASWNLQLDKPYIPACPYLYPDGGESMHMMGHLIIPKRCC